MPFLRVNVRVEILFWHDKYFITFFYIQKKKTLHSRKLTTSSFRTTNENFVNKHYSNRKLAIIALGRNNIPRRFIRLNQGNTSGATNYNYVLERTVANFGKIVLAYNALIYYSTPIVVDSNLPAKLKNVYDFIISLPPFALKLFKVFFELHDWYSSPIFTIVFFLLKSVHRPIMWCVNKDVQKN